MFLYDSFFQHITLSFLPKNMKASQQNITTTHSSTNKLKELATCSKEELFKTLESSEKGLSQHEADRRILKFGKNIISENKKTNPFIVIFDNIKNPLTLMLIVLASISLYMGDLRMVLESNFMNLSYKRLNFLLKILFLEILFI